MHNGPSWRRPLHGSAQQIEIEHTFFYDDIGNPLSYYNGYRYTMTWEQGRQLESVTYNTKTTTYQYNRDGIRTKKTNSDGSYVVYYLANGKAIGETHFNADDTIQYYLRYTFDETGSVVGFSHWGTNGHWQDYYFVKNLQGDVLQVYSEFYGTCVASYTYDSWGNILTSSGAFADINPFRYRTYYYDSETWFYYLQSRYYDPSIGRFINADAQISGVGGEILGYNMFAYCMNNPVNMTDQGGNWPSWSTVLKATAIAVTTIAVVATAAVAVASFGLASIAATIAISSAITIVSKVTEVAVLQAKKSANEGKDTGQIVTDVIDSAFDNGMGTIAKTAVTKTSGYATGFYSQSSSFQDVLQLQKMDGSNLKTLAGAATHEITNRFTDFGGCLSANASAGSMAFSYFFAGLNAANMVISIFADDPVQRATSRGCTLK